MLSAQIYVCEYQCRMYILTWFTLCTIHCTYNKRIAMLNTLEPSFVFVRFVISLFLRTCCGYVYVCVVFARVLLFTIICILNISNWSKKTRGKNYNFQVGIVFMKCNSISEEMNVQMSKIQFHIKCKTGQIKFKCE